MKILAVDTAMGVCSVALADSEEIIAETEEQERARQAELLVPMIEKLLEKAGWNYSDLTLLATTTGPGSFTGIRIGMTALKGIALATSLPTVGVNTLETIAWQATQQHNPNQDILALLNAMRGQVYAQRFTPDITAKNEPVLLDVEEIPTLFSNNLLITGNCTDIVDAPDNCTVTENITPHAKDVAFLSMQRFKKNSGNTLEPLYIRKPDAKLPAT